MLTSAVGITFLIIGIVLLLIILFGIIPPFIIANKVFNSQLVRNDKTKWLRECSAPDNVEQMAMYNAGLEWAKGFKDKIEEVEITSFDGLHLVGEYFNFNSDKCVIILQGRTESLWYTYYYAKPYSDMGYNILVVDSRAHGLSEGKYNTVGLKEYKDILKWADLIHDKYGISKFILHGICIGSATALYAITEDKKDYFKAIIADGMYTSFYETFRTHMIEEKRPVHPFIDFVRLIMKIKTGVDMKSYGPEKAIKKLNKPILFLYSKEDKFSLPAKSDYLYDITPGDKKIVWFDHGAHSHIRINNLEKYDQEVKDFCNAKFE